jgi:hypothetical protein
MRRDPFRFTVYGHSRICGVRCKVVSRAPKIGSGFRKEMGLPIHGKSGVFLSNQV